MLFHQNHLTSVVAIFNALLEQKLAIKIDQDPLENKKEYERNKQRTHFGAELTPQSPKKWH